MNDLRRYRSFIMDSGRWEGFDLRAGDVVVTTPPKCGTTWMQAICAHLLWGDDAFTEPLSVTSPWLEELTAPVEDVHARLAAQSSRRCIKSHTPMDGVPWSDEVSYIAVYRDPREVWMSWSAHRANTVEEKNLELRIGAVGYQDLLDREFVEAPEDPHEQFRQWADPDDAFDWAVSNLPLLLHHLETVRSIEDRPNVAVFHHSDLGVSPHAEIRRVAELLGMHPDDRMIAEVAAATGIDAMRQRAADLIPDGTHEVWRSKENFFRSGAGQTWRSFLDDDDLAVYDHVMDDLTDPAERAWLER